MLIRASQVLLPSAARRLAIPLLSACGMQSSFLFLCFFFFFSFSCFFLVFSAYFSCQQSGVGWEMMHLTLAMKRLLAAAQACRAGFGRAASGGACKWQQSHLEGWGINECYPGLVPMLQFSSFYMHLERGVI